MSSPQHLQRNGNVTNLAPSWDVMSILTDDVFPHLGSPSSCAVARDSQAAAFARLSVVELQRQDLVISRKGLLRLDTAVGNRAVAAG